ncbi:hypothetical protein KO561_06530 [Radiobacillus kanasensis]|uniref:hypothetical protein n=1 Tax=Radiobacillus kanasensis TaxID=2844358 RepID=UPI001E47F7E2|nr:hypothetical protein [Radiobacillus kanasensis]UFU00591.1 hypothetical protein KO561_06530 [Radiobacillus kanasensis]
MGYLLPIPNYQYSDYHTRITSKGTDPIHIGKIYKAKLDRNRPFEEQLDELREEPEEMVANREKRRRTYYHAPMEQLYAELTGVGKHINERI